MTPLSTQPFPRSGRLHVAITGNIGAGKTTLAQRLAQEFNWEVYYEAVEGNPYLSDFYGDMARWAFHLQIYFLRSRYEQVLRISQLEQPIIQDRTIYEDAHIFARNLYQSGLMSARDYENYLDIFNLMLSVVQPPDLMIYLRADVDKLLAQIRRRGRDFEQNISEAYLTDLNALYDHFAETYSAGPLLVIDVNDLDFAHREADWQRVLESVKTALKTAENEKARRGDGLT